MPIKELTVGGEESFKSKHGPTILGWFSGCGVANPIAGFPQIKDKFTHWNHGNGEFAQYNTAIAVLIGLHLGDEFRDFGEQLPFGADAMVLLHTVDGAWRAVLANPGCIGKMMLVLGCELRRLPVPVKALLLIELPTPTTFATSDGGFAATGGTNRRWGLTVITAKRVRQRLAMAGWAELLALLAVWAIDLAQAPRHNQLAGAGRGIDLGSG